MSKAAATFVKGKPKGEVNYPPYEVQDDATAAEHEKFEVQPIGHIGEYPKRIPYNSEKKTFQQKTGMDGLEGTSHYLNKICVEEKLIHEISLPVHFQNAGRYSRQGRTYCDVGLQCGLGESHIVLQKPKALKGMQCSCGPCQPP